MPNRLLKDSIRTSQSVNAMSDLEFRVWVSLIVSADDYGRGKADAKIIKGACFPLQDKLTPTKIKRAVESLAGRGSLILYTVENELFYEFPKWAEHQTVRNKRSKYPAPEDGNTIENNCLQMLANASVIQSNPNQAESNSGGARFTPPTVEEIAAYCAERCSRVDPERFFNYYSANGWRVGKSPMRDWKAALRNWDAEDRKKGQSSNPFLAYAEGGL